MEIQSLRVLLTDADLAVILREIVPDQESIEGLEGRFTPEGVQVQGRYPTPFGLKVPFETLWQLQPTGAVVQVQLASVKVAGLPAGLLRGALLGMIQDALDGRPGVTLHEETLLVDISALAQDQGLEVKLAFTAVQLAVGTIVVEAG